MATEVTKVLQPVQQPALPLPPVQYSKLYQDQYNNILRLYFNRLSTAVNALTGGYGGQYVPYPNLLVFDTAEQFFAAPNVMEPIVFDATYLSYGVQLRDGSTSEIEALVNGIYNFQYTGQITSSSSSAKTMYVWISRNGVDIGYSTRAVTLTSNAEQKEINWAFNIDLQEGDYVEMRAAVTDIDLHLHAEPATAVHPGIPSGVMTVNYVAPLPETLPTPP